MDERQIPPTLAGSICLNCGNHRRIQTQRGSMFIMCTEPSLPKYGCQPISQCAHFQQGKESNLDSQ